MTAQDNLESSGLVALVGEQLELYQRLDSLSVRQHDLVAADDTDGLLAVLGARQQLIESIADSAARMAPFRARWDDHVCELKDTDRESLRKGLDDLSAMMAVIADRDESDRVAMEERRDRVKSQITGVKRGSAAVNAYGGPAGARGPRFQDREA
jgi:hypothetical protein